MKYIIVLLLVMQVITLNLALSNRDFITRIVQATSNLVDVIEDEQSVSDE